MSFLPLFLLLLVCTATRAQNQVAVWHNPAVGKYADVNGIRLYYEIYGEGHLCCCCMAMAAPSAAGPATISLYEQKIQGHRRR